MKVRIFFILLEIFILVMFTLSVPFINVGNILGIAVTVLMFIGTIRWKNFCEIILKLWQSTIGKTVLYVVGGIVVISVGFAVFFTVNMIKAMNNKPEKPDILVVLGCQVRGESPSTMLRKRLDVAKKYMEENPDVKCIVTGGKGYDEKISEALCMKNYLVENGIDESRIIMEDKSTNTDENLKFSFDIIDSMGLERNITLITDGYHQYRAKLIAYKQGAKDVHSLSANTEFRFLAPYWLREWFGIAQQMFLK